MNVCLACSKDCTLRCANCKVVRFCGKDCQVEAWKHHKAFCKSVCNPAKSNSSSENKDQTCVIIDGFGPCGSGWDDMVKARQRLLLDGMHVVHINGGKGGNSISLQVASLLLSETKPNALIFFGFGSGGDGSDEKFFKETRFVEALKSWCDSGGRFIVQGERTKYTGSWPSWFGKKWKDGNYFRTDHKCFASGSDATSWCTWYKDSPGAVLSRYNVKACMLQNVDTEDVLFGAVEGAKSYSLVPGFGGQDVGENQTAVAFSRFGNGTVSFFGDVNHEEATLKIMSVIARGQT
jgi:hypothetical protein